MSLPASLRILAKTSDSVELRFRALLSASRPDLGEHLRHAVTLVASHGLAIDWRDLHAAVQYWDHSSDRTRRQWARDFWSYAGRSEPTENPA
jgi:CRISPR type I-E-associated protein CasB/Cse2